MKRARVKGRIVLMLTANPHYRLSRIQPGVKLTAAIRHRLHLGKALRIGRNDWYLSPGRRSDGVLKVQHGVIQEIGLADKALLARPRGPEALPEQLQRRQAVAGLAGSGTCNSALASLRGIC